MTIANPYETPTVELNQTADTTGSVSNLFHFRRISTWAVLGLSIITLGFYMYYWAYNRSQAFKYLGEKGISSAGLGVLIVTGVTGLAIPLVVGFLAGYEQAVSGELTDYSSSYLGLQLFTDSLTLISIIAFVWLAFTMRNRLNAFFAKENLAIKLNPVLTFFFSIFYIQFKINQGLDTLNQSEE